MHNEFSQRLAVVTGCSSGIGLEVCRLLLEAGTRVVGMSRTLGELAPLQHAYPQQLHWLAGDVTQPTDLQALARYVQPLGAIDYLVPNAGIAELAEGVQPQAFARQWAVNGDGALNTLAVLRGQLASPAAVVFIGTFLVQRSFPGLAAYIASKAALVAYARTLAVELAAAQIRVNTVSPGPTATAIWGKLGLPEETLAAVASGVNQRLLSGEFLDAAAVAEVVLFQLSRGARGVWGQDWVVDNGFTLS